MDSQFSLLNAYKTEEAMLLLRSLSHPTRIKIVNLLLENEQLTLTDIQTAFPSFNKEMLTRHLNILFASNMVEKEIVGNEISYQAQQEKLEKIMALVSDFS
jgi:DNA-binding transcriptional ArsR family regulator